MSESDDRVGRRSKIEYNLYIYACQLRFFLSFSRRHVYVYRVIRNYGIFCNLRADWRAPLFLGEPARDETRDAGHVEPRSSEDALSTPWNTRVL